MVLIILTTPIHIYPLIVINKTKNKICLEKFMLLIQNVYTFYNVTVYSYLVHCDDYTYNILIEIFYVYILLPVFCIYFYLLFFIPDSNIKELFVKYHKIKKKLLFKLIKALDT